MAFPTGAGKRGFKHGFKRDFLRGFTLIELLVVLAILALLLTLATPRLFHSLDRSKETVLRENLHVTRGVINKFYTDHGRYPRALDELVERQYLRALPRDPVTDSNATWLLVADEREQGVADLRSGAPGLTADGLPFSGL